MSIEIVDLQGRKFRSLADAAAANGLTRGTIYKRHRRDPRPEYLFAKKTPIGPIVDLKGRKFSTLTEAAKANGFNKYTLLHRFQRNRDPEYVFRKVNYTKRRPRSALMQPDENVEANNRALAAWTPPKLGQC